MSWVRSPDYSNTLGGKRKRERDDLRRELEGNMGGVVGGLDALAKAQKAAGLEVERKEDRSKKQADDLAQKKLDAEKLARELEDRARKTRIDDEDRAIAGEKRARDVDDLERKKALAAEADERARSDLDLKASRSVLERVVAAGIEAGKTPEEIANEARENPNLAAITGDEEVEAEYRKQRQPERDRIAKAQEQMMIDKARAEANMDRDAAKAALHPKGGAGGGMADLRRQKMEADLDLAKSRAAAAKAGAGAEGKAPTTTEAMAVSEIDTLIGNVGAIRSAKGGVNTGPVAGRLGVLATKVGMGDPEVTSFRAEVGSQLADYIKGISGAAASDKERAFLEQNVPNVNDSDDEFIAKLDRLEVWAKRKRATLLDALQAAKRDVSGFRSVATERAAEVPDEEIDAILDEHPDWTEEQIEAELKRRQRG